MEFLKDTEIIFENKFNSKSIEFDGIKIGETIEKIVSKSIVDSYNNDTNSKIDPIKIKNGWVLTENGVQFFIKKHIVYKIHIKKKGLNSLVNYNTSEIQKKIGKPDKVSNDGIMWVWDNIIDAKVYHYKKRQLRIHFSTDNGLVSGLEIRKKSFW